MRLDRSRGAAQAGPAPRGETCRFPQVKAMDSAYRFGSQEALATGQGGCRAFWARGSWWSPSDLSPVLICLVRVEERGTLSSEKGASTVAGKGAARVLGQQVRPLASVSLLAPPPVNWRPGPCCAPHAGRPP